MIDPQADLEARWLPDTDVVQAAGVLLDAERIAEYALVPMVQPGKQRGVWTTGQLVETVPGVVALAADCNVGPGLPVTEHFVARARVAEAACRHLGDRPGTTGYAVIWRDGNVSVFEDF